MPENNNNKLLPKFESLDKLVDYFDDHDLGDHLDKMDEVEIEVDLKQKVHLIALDEDLANKLAEIARSEHTSSATLVNAWVREKIQAQK